MITEYIFQIDQHSSITPRTILEIGALDGQYSRKLQTHYNLPESSVYLVEPNPVLNEKLTQEFPAATVFNVAVSDTYSNRSNFNVVNSKIYGEVGCSSLMARTPNKWNNYISTLHSEITVTTVTGESLLSSIKKPIDLCIIDVEGHSYNVIRSFQASIKEIKSIMVECEHIEFFQHQKLYDDVQSILIKNQFRLMTFRYSYKNQSDSIWIQESCINFEF